MSGLVGKIGHLSGSCPTVSRPFQDSLFRILTGLVLLLVELPVMLKFGNIGVFVVFQGDTQLRKIRPQISFSLVPLYTVYKIKEFWKE